MPLKLYYFPSFKRSLRTLSAAQIKTVGKVLEAVDLYYASGCDISAAKRLSPRFFYKQLRRPYYEAGIEGKLRVIIKRDGSKCTAIIAGKHDQIKTFLKDA